MESLRHKDFWADGHNKIESSSSLLDFALTCLTWMVHPKTDCHHPLS